MLVLSMLSFSLAVAQCDYSLELTDQFGDGWANGSTIVVTIAGGTPQTYSVAAGSSSNVITLTVNTGDSIDLDYRPLGATPGENSYVLTDSEGIVVFDAGFNPAAAINNFTASCPTCPAVSAINAPTVGGDTADISWTPGGTETEWIVEYGVSPYTCGSGGTQVTTTTNPTTNPTTITGLAPLTTYDFYVIAVCSPTDQSACQGPIQVTTSSLCPEPFNFAPINNAARQIDFGWDPNGNAGGTVTIEYAPDGVITTPGTNQGTQIPLNPSGFAFITGLTPDTCYDFYVQNDCTNGFTSIWSAEYEACTTISCFEPSALTASAISSDSMTIDWTAGQGETEWELEYAPTGTITTPFDTTPQGTLINVMTTPSQQLTALADATTYDVYVRAVCDRSLSDFSAPVQISPTTLCLPLPAPFNESFDTAALPNCWSSSADDGAWAYGGPTNTAVCTNAASDFNANGGSFAWVDLSGTDNNVLLSSPLIDVSGLTVPFLTFQQWMCTSGYTPGNELYVEANDGTGTFVQVALVNTGSDAWTEYGFSLAPYVSANNTVQFRFRVESGGSTSAFNGDIAIDDISVAEAPACIDPSNLTATNITPTSADLGFQENNVPPATNWTLEYAEAGVITAPGTAQGTEVLMSANPHPATGLSPNTIYEFYVKTICSATEESDYTGPFTFRTDCAPETVTFTTDYESDALTSLSPCESGLIIGGGASTVVEVEDLVSNSGSQHIEMNSGSPLPTEMYYISPEFSDLSNDKRVRFFAYDRDTGGIEVGVMTDPTDETTFTSVETFTDADLADDTYQLVTVNFTSITLTGGYIAIKFNPAGTFDAMFIDDFIYETIPSCPEPLNFVSNGNDDVSIDLSWDLGGSESEWIVEYATPDFATGTVQQVTGVTNNTNYILGGLTSNTPYEARVVAVCAPGDISPASFPVVFRTNPQGPQGVNCPSNNAAFAWEEDFDNGFNGWTGDAGTANGEWDFTGGDAFNGGTGSTGTGPFAPAQGTNYIFFETSGTNVGPRSIVSPAIDLTNATDEAELSFFFHSIGGDLTTFEVGVGTDPAGPFTNVFTFVGPLQSDQNDPYALIGAALPPSVLGSATVHIQITGTEEVGNELGFVGDVAVDFMRIETCGSFCSNPDMLAVANVTTTSADLSFNDTGGTPTGNYEYVIQTPGTGVPTAAGIASTSTTVPLTTLTPATLYEIYVRNVCGGTAGFSDWVGPFTFATGCDVFTVPFLETFDVGSGSETCWTVLDENGDGDEWRLDNTLNAFSGESAAINTDFNGGANDDYLISPAITLTGNERLRYQYRVRSSFEPDDFEVLLSTTTPDVAGLTNVILPQATYSNTTYVEETIDLSAFTGDVYIAWRVPATPGQDGWEIYVDDVIVETIPACLNVTDVDADQITSSGANLFWTENDGATDWEFEYDVTGFVQGSGANGITSTNDNMVNGISGLTSDTSYDVYVRSVCSSVTGFSNWVGPFTFTTRCDALTAVYTNDYESDPLDGLNNCEDNLILTTATNVVVEVEDFIANSGSQHIYMYSGSDAVAQMYYILPEFSDLDNTKRVKFFAYDRDNGALEVGTMTDPGDASTFTSVRTFTDADLPDDQYEEQIVNFTSLTTTGGWIAFKYNAPGTFDAMYIDDVTYELIPACAEPISVSLLSRTDTTLELSWLAGNSETEWEVEYGAPGFTPGSGIMTIPSVTTNTSFTIPNLMPNTPYDVYIYAVCSTTLTSGPSNVFSTRTLPGSPDGVSCPQNNPLFIYSEEFDSTTTAWTGDVGTTLGQWEFGQAAGTGSTGTGPLSAQSGSGYVFFDTSGTNVGPRSVVSPAIDLSQATDDAELSFFFHSFGGDQTTFEVGVGATATGPFTNIFTFVGPLQTAQTDPFELIGADIPVSFLGADVYIQLTATEEVGNEAGFVGDVAVDRMRIETCADICVDPSGILVSNISSVGAQIDWTENGSASQWEVEVQPTGTAQGTAGAAYLNTTAGNPDTAGGLTPLTSYDVYVRSSCGMGDFSNWVGPVTFTTACAPFTAPYGSVSGAAGNDFSTFAGACWEEGDNTDIATGPNGITGAWFGENFANDPASAFGQAAAINIWNTGAINDWLVSPEIDLGAGGFDVTFNIAHVDFNSQTASAFDGTQQVQLLVSDDNGVTWTNLQTWDASTAQVVTGELVTVPLGTTYTGIVRFAFWGSNGLGGVSGTNDTEFYVDNFTVDATQSIDSPQELGFSYYPNPTRDVVTFNGDQTIDMITVSNMLGQEVIRMAPGTTQTQIDLSTFNTGVYLVTVETADRRSTVKIVKE